MPVFRFCPQCGQELPPPPLESHLVVQQNCQGCGAVHFQNAKPTASALIVREGQVLMGRRAVEPFRGYWDIPGGFLNPWEHPSDCVVREVMEETGLMVQPTGILGIFIDRYGSQGDYTLNIYYFVDTVGGKLQPGDDIDQLRWFALDALPDQIAFQNNREALSHWVAQLPSDNPSLPSGHVSSGENV